MKYIVKSALVDEPQETACAIQYSSEILFMMIHEALAYMDSEPNIYSKEQLLGQVDAIRLLAKHLDLEAVMVEV